MSGVFQQIRWPLKKRHESCGSDPAVVDPRLMQLQEAKEILAEVLGIDVFEVDEMIRCRGKDGNRQEVAERWPEMLWV